jgi:hypothetical protein
MGHSPSMCHPEAAFATPLRPIAIVDTASAL